MKINSEKETISAYRKSRGKIRHSKTSSCGYLGFELNKLMEFAGNLIHNGAMEDSGLDE
jgi:hypothetical protein